MYKKDIANKKSTIEAIENAGTVLATIAASKIGEQFGVSLTGDQLLIVGGAIKVLFARIRNRIKHRVVVS